MDIAAQDGSGEAHEGVAEVDDEVRAERADVGPLWSGIGRGWWGEDLEAAEAVGEEGQGAEVCVCGTKGLVSLGWVWLSTG
jgi:hypothetical protein